MQQHDQQLSLPHECSPSHLQTTKTVTNLLWQNNSKTHKHSMVGQIVQAGGWQKIRKGYKVHDNSMFRCWKFCKELSVGLRRAHWHSWIPSLSPFKDKFGIDEGKYKCYLNQILDLFRQKCHNHSQTRSDEVVYQQLPGVCMALSY